MIDVHNGGCADLSHMMSLAQKILQTTDAKTALIAAVQNAAGPTFTQSEIRKLAHAPVPGDGCGVGLLVKSEDAPILGVVCRNYPEFAGDMTFEGVPKSDRKSGNPVRARRPSASPNRRSRRFSPAATGWCLRWRTPCSIRSTPSPET